MNLKFSLLLTFLIFINFACSKNIEAEEKKQPNVIIIVMDGARYTETYGDSLNRYTPFLNDTLAPLGTVCKNYYNSGNTYTISGHVAITTGFNLFVVNNGTEYPEKHSIFQEWLSSTGKDKSKAWIITSKDKLEVLTNCNDSIWYNKDIPSFDCGIEGLGSGYRNDSITIKVVFDVLMNDKPNLLLVNFKEPDDTGHKGNWENYLNEIKKTDSYISEIWHYVINDPFYMDNTTFIVTNDHGRHLDSTSNGFSSHGDDCDGCRHICMWAYGKNIKVDYEDTVYYDQRDLNRTTSHLLGIKDISDGGDVMWSILN